MVATMYGNALAQGIEMCVPPANERIVPTTNPTRILLKFLVTKPIVAHKSDCWTRGGDVVFRKPDPERVEQKATADRTRLFNPFRVGCRTF